MTLKTPPSRFGQRIRYMRTERGWSQSELERHAGLTNQKVTQIERWLHYFQPLPFWVLARLARAFELSVVELTRGTEYDCEAKETK